jgi:multiple sugar transport system permease protein/raffinose/stachyose/melibiose transport system permease protein
MMRKAMAWSYMELKWLVFVIPSLLFYLFFFIVPSISATFYSLTDWDGITYSFIGLQNYRDMLDDDNIKTAFINTLIYALSITVLQNTLGLFLAVLLDRKMRMVNAMRTLFFMPAIFSSLVIGYVWGYMLEPNIGVVNHVLSVLHLDALKQDWLGNPHYGIAMIILVTVWQFCGYSMVIFLAGLQGIPKDMYESASLEGAGAADKFKHITFPLLAPSFTINILLTTIGCLKLFDQIYAMTKGGPGYSTQSVATMIYTVGFGSGGQWGYGTAISIVLFVFILVFSSIQVTLLRRREVDM